MVSIRQFYASALTCSACGNGVCTEAKILLTLQSISPIKMKNNTLNILLYSIIAAVMVIVAGVPGAMAARHSKQKFVVVIDAGHGGKDPGAQDNGVKEKDVNLGVALKLGEFLKKNLKDVKVIYTRDKDEYLTLQERAEKANKANANLFISLHVNSADAANPRRISLAGSSVHVLGQSKDRKNADVVKRENSVIKLEKGYAENYQGFDPDSDESYIIFEMIQKRQQERSLDLAQEIQKQLKTVAGRRTRGVTQEPFWVLWATSMPAVLVEMDFICNPNSAKYLASETGQNRIAKALFNSIRTYYTQELALAREPKATPEAEDEEINIADGQTYVSDGFAIIGSSVSPERKVTASTGGKTSTRRVAGSRRRSAAARAASASLIREQKEMNVRTHAEPEALSAKNAQKPRTTASANTAEMTAEKSSKPDKKGKNKSAKADKQKRNKENQSASAKKAKSNKRRGQKAVIVMPSQAAATAQTGQTAQTSQTSQTGRTGRTSQTGQTGQTKGTEKVEAKASRKESQTDAEIKRAFQTDVKVQAKAEKKAQPKDPAKAEAPKAVKVQAKAEPKKEKKAKNQEKLPQPSQAQANASAVSHKAKRARLNKTH